MIYAEVKLHVSVRRRRHVPLTKALSDTYEENHREQQARGHKHCKEEKPSYWEARGNSHPTCTSLTPSKVVRMKFTPAPPIMNQRTFGGRMGTEESVFEG
jgi:hypothetical protein